MTLSLSLSAIRRHLISVTFTALLTIVTASLLGISAPLSIVAWLVTGLVCFEVWYVAEPVVFERLGACRQPSAAEHQRIEGALGRTHLQLLIADSSNLAVFRGLRCLVIGRDLLDVLEDRGLSGLLTQAAAPLHAANLAGFILVWIGNLPSLAAWWMTRLVGQLARLLALVVATSLVVPMVLCRDAFLHWAGLAFTSMLVFVIGAILLSYGFAALGLGLLLAWLIVPLVRAVLNWESRRVENSVDGTTIAAGLGPQLLEAIDFLTLLEPRQPEAGLFSLLYMPGSSMVDRGRRIRRVLSVPAPVE